MKILIFGVGCVYKKNKYKISDFDILAFLDNDVKKQGKLFDGRIIDTPENHWKYKYDAIIIASVHYVEIRKQLISLGIAETKIIDEKHRGFFEGLHIIHEYKLLEKNEQACKKILLVSHELTNTGAPVVLYNLAYILKKNNYYVEVLSVKKGPMLYDFLSIGVSVKIVDWWSMVTDEYFCNFDLVFLNTIVTYPIANRLAYQNRPVLWWLHEDKQSMQFLHISKTDIPYSKNIRVLSIGKRVEDAYKELTGYDVIEELCFGLKFHKVKNENKRKDKLICVVIGYVNEIKGQDLLLKAIKEKENNWRDKIEFWIIGSISDKDRHIYEKYKIIKVWGSIEHERLMDIFSEVDIVLCPSRHESMSAAVIEGMMHKKLCIVSSETGIANYCTHQKNALIMENENVESLKQNIDWVLINTDLCKKIAEKGYEIYLNNFTIEKFEAEVLKILKSIFES